MLKFFSLFKSMGKKAALLLTLALVLTAATVGSTVAYIVARTRNIPNNFPPAEIEISSWNYGDVVNAGNVDIYVRASIIPAWVSNDDKKTVWSQKPIENIDYTLEIDSDWILASDGYYYKKHKINAAQSVQFISATQNTQVEGFTLRILVMYSAIQTTPTEAVESSWTAIEIVKDGTDEDGTLRAK